MSCDKPSSPRRFGSTAKIVSLDSLQNILSYFLLFVQVISTDGHQGQPDASMPVSELETFMSDFHLPQKAQNIYAEQTASSSFAYGIHTGLSTAGASSSRSVRNCLSLDVTRQEQSASSNASHGVNSDLSQTVSLITAAEPGAAGHSHSSQPVRRRIFPKDTKKNARQQRHASHIGSDDAEGNMTRPYLYNCAQYNAAQVAPQRWLSYNSASDMALIYFDLRYGSHILDMNTGLASSILMFGTIFAPLYLGGPNQTCQYCGMRFWLEEQMESLLTLEEKAILDQNETPDVTKISSPKWHPLHSYALVLQIPLMDKLLSAKLKSSRQIDLRSLHIVPGAQSSYANDFPEGFGFESTHLMQRRLSTDPDVSLVIYALPSLVILSCPSYEEQSRTLKILILTGQGNQIVLSITQRKKLSALEAGTDNEQSLVADSTILPMRPFEPLCSEKCKFGAKFNHPKGIEVLPLIGKQTIYTSTIDEIPHIDAADSSVPAKTHALAKRQKNENKECVGINGILTPLKAFGYTVQALEMLLLPMAKNGDEALGSMGNDTLQ
ncbi:hypothetical protein ACP4OV_029456 [Aristida adscensionis]